MKIFFSALIILFAIAAYPQEINKTVVDKKADAEILIGACDRSGLEEGKFGKTFKKEYRKYEPDQQVLDQLKKKLKLHFITVVMGTWCHDTKEQVPRFFHVLDSLDYPESNLTLIAVDTKKKAGEVDISELDIERIPTFIVYRRGIEIGRIVETPQESIEKDLLDVISN